MNHLPKHGDPVLRGFVSQDRNQIRVICPFCHQHHTHQWSPRYRAGAKRHVSAGCWTVYESDGATVHYESPLKETGYWIGEYRGEDLDDAKHHRVIRRIKRPIYTRRLGQTKLRGWTS